MSLERFVTAQAQIYPRVLAELKAGQKQSHWMWFIFPQIAGLGDSAMRGRFTPSSRWQEAQDYLAHPVLGARLRECCQAVMAVEGKTAHDIFGSPDDMKFRSSLTLFAEAAPDELLFRDLLEKYFDGEADAADACRSLRSSSAAFRGATLSIRQLPSPAARSARGGRCRSEVSAEPT